jgi:hypothetical protein
MQETKYQIRRQKAMAATLDSIVARQRYEDRLQEAEQIRLARRVAKANGAQSLLSRMVKLLSRSSRPSQDLGRSEGALNQPQLADAKGS